MFPFSSQLRATMACPSHYLPAPASRTESSGSVICSTTELITSYHKHVFITITSFLSRAHLQVSRAAPLVARTSQPPSLTLWSAALQGLLRYCLFSFASAPFFPFFPS